MSTSPVPAAETTGEIVLSFGPDGPVVSAPDLAAVPLDELFGLERDPSNRRAVALPGGVRYLIGAAHKRWPRSVYLHRLP